MHLIAFPPQDSYALAIHGGAGPRGGPLTPEQEAAYRTGLESALVAGRTVLADGGSAVDAVTEAVVTLEDDDLFNAGRGAALTTDGTAELDACLMDGTDRSTGAVIGSRFARNPIRAARAVRDNSRHVLVADLPRDLVEAWGLDVVDPSYFVTERRLAQLQGRALADPSTPAAHPPASANAPSPGPTSPPGSVLGHGTVGAVARDLTGAIAAATSTGGVTGQWAGRVGDSPIVGAGTFADHASIAISCTGIGEYFIRGVLAHDIAARIHYRGDRPADAIRDAIEEHLTGRGGDGGLIAVTPDGQILLAYNSDAMFRGYVRGDGVAIADV